MVLRLVSDFDWILNDVAFARYDSHDLDFITVGINCETYSKILLI